MVAAGAVMGGILSIAAYSVAVGSGNTGNQGTFGALGGGNRQGQAQGVPGQGQGGFQQPQGGLQPQPGQGQGQGQGQGLPGQRQAQPVNPGQVPGQAPGQVQPNNQGADAVTNLLPRAPDFVGQVRTVSGSSLTVDTPQGSRVVQVTDETQFIRADGSAGSAADLTRGSVVAVVTSTDPATRVLKADAIGLVSR